MNIQKNFSICQAEIENACKILASLPFLVIQQRSEESYCRGIKTEILQIALK
jgi:hypothetical protein